MYSSGDSGCEFCVEGTYSDGKAECQNCPASTSPNYQLQYNWWNTMPLNMTSECALFSGLSFILFVDVLYNMFLLHKIHNQNLQMNTCLDYMVDNRLEQI
jgi:hypothetical protein